MADTSREGLSISLFTNAIAKAYNNALAMLGEVTSRLSEA